MGFVFWATLYYHVSLSFCNVEEACWIFVGFIEIFMPGLCFLGHFEV